MSLADTAATPVGRTDVEVTDASSLPGPYRLEATLTPGRHFAVTAHVDLGGDGAISSGDLLSTTRVAVPTDRDAVVLDVPVTLID